jgi:endonuclease YncB( thermonuclease family)
MRIVKRALLTCVALITVSLVVAMAGCASVAGASHSATTARATVSYVVDGDTIALANGRRVRLLQIDAPELGTEECYSRKSTKELRRLLPQGAAISLIADPRLDRTDLYGRLLRYVMRGSTNVNVALAARGAATVWFYGGAKGRYAGSLLHAAGKARAARRGMWGACRTVWDPYESATTATKGSHGATPVRRVATPPTRPSASRRLRRTWTAPTSATRTLSFRSPDPHRFDADGDGRGCE